MDLAELDRLEREATAGEWHWESSRLSRCSLEDRAFIVATRNSMRPLLTLVAQVAQELRCDRVKLSTSRNCLDAYRLPCSSCTALAAWKEAQGE